MHGERAADCYDLQCSDLAARLEEHEEGTDQPVKTLEVVTSGRGNIKQRSAYGRTAAALFSAAPPVIE